MERNWNNKPLSMFHVIYIPWHISMPCKQHYFGYNSLYMDFPQQCIVSDNSKKFSVRNSGHYFIIITNVHVNKINIFSYELNITCFIKVNDSKCLMCSKILNTSFSKFMLWLVSITLVPYANKIFFGLIIYKNC